MEKEDDEEDDDENESSSLTYSSTSRSSSFSASSSSIGVEVEATTEVGPLSSNVQPIVDNHFSKALGVETWNKLKTNVWPPLSASSPVHSSFSNYKTNQAINHDDHDDDDEQNTEDEIESELKREQDERTKKQTLASSPCPSSVVTTESRVSAQS
jgi:hypothetical protein